MQDKPTTYVREQQASYSILPFESAESVVQDEPDEPDYIIEQLLIRGAISALTAKIKAGKTTLLGASLRAIFSGEDLIGLRTKKARGIYCTEEGRKTFRSFLGRTGLEDTGGRLDILFLGKVPRNLPWIDTVREIAGYAMGTNADFVIFDTLTRWARIKPDQENDAGAAAAVMEPLEILRAAGIATLVVFHERKSGGDINDSARGSSAFGGAADILLQLKDPQTNGHPNRRVLTSVGRFDDPGEWTMDWQDGEYTLQDAEDGQVERNIVKKLIDNYLLSAGPIAQPALWEIFKTQTTDRTFRRALADMTKADLIVKTAGKGVKSDPYTWDAHPLRKGGSQ